MRLILCGLAFSAVAYASAIGGSAELNPVRTHGRVPAVVDEAGYHQIIVKLRPGAAAGTGSGTAAAQQSVSAHIRVANLAQRARLTLHAERPIVDRLQVVQVERASSDEPVEPVLQRLRADPEVEYAVADERRQAHAIPTDTLYPLGGQWYEQADPGTPAAVNAQAAWDITTGDPQLVIADLDTGVRYDHPDILALSASGRLLPGYDFISNTAVANDGDGRDADASDPGDWINAADLATTQFKSCTSQISSWHGTRTAGLLGAMTNNAKGIAGMTWTGNILPVRVLGKCGGYDSDIIAAMMWAAGLPVAGVPANPNPARIINMSLGSSETCPQSYADVISQLTNLGVLVVASAGNEGGPVDAPADCAGVAAVAGVRHAGTKVGYSSLGPQVTVSAPAGNCVNTSGTCVYSIQTTTNSGTTTPVAQDNAYTGTTIVADTQPKGPNLGTSFSAPIVSGIAALMLAANGNLNTCQMVARLKEGASPFPQSSPGETPQPSQCHVPTGSTDVQNLECICTNDGQTCGAGMANALGAVQAALRPIAAVSLPAQVTAGSAVALDGQDSAAASGHAISTYQWSSIGSQSVSIQNSTSATASVTAPACGFATVQLTVTDDGGRTDTANVVLSPTSASSTAPISASSRSCSTSTPAAVVAVCPGAGTVYVGGASQTFAASAAYVSDASVTWEVNNIPGGSATVGTITSTGVYTPPSAIPQGSSAVTIKAVLNSDQSVAGISSVNITTAPAAGSHGGGGSMDLLTLLAGALSLVAGQRRQARRAAASSQGF